MINAGNIILDGVSLCGGAFYKAADGTMKETECMAVVSKTGKGIEPPYIFAVTKEAACYEYQTLSLTEGLTYRISGTVAPVGTVVHLSEFTEADIENVLVSEGAEDIEDLNVIKLLTNTQTDEAASGESDGAFEFPNLITSEKEKAVAVWIRIKADFTTVYTAKLNINADTDITCQTFAVAKADETKKTYPVITVTGTAPEGTTVYLSKSAGTNTLSALGSAKLTSASVSSSGTYSKTYTGDAGTWGTLAVWCVGEQVELTAELTWEEHELADKNPNPGEGAGGNCSGCSGTGYIEYTCPTCGGSGTTSTTDSDGNTVEETCTECNGSGHIWETCSTCGGSGNEETCLSGDTLITMADGSEKRLDALKVGELIRGKDGPAAVAELRRGSWSPYHTLYTFADGTVIDETHPHRFYSAEQGFWQKLGLWRIGEHAVRLDGTETALVSVERLEEPAEMFGLWADGHTYWANGLLSGDARANLPLLEAVGPERAAEMAASLGEEQIFELCGEEILP